MSASLPSSSSLSFISIGCNRIANCATWGSNGLVAFGAGNFVGIYNVQNRELTETLRGHTGRVNAVHWISETEIISASSDKSIIVWKQNAQSKIFEVAHTLQAHKGSVTNLAILLFPKEEGKVLAVGTSVDKTVSVWQRDTFESDWTLIQHNSLVNEAAESSALTFLPESETPLLALGGVGGSGSCRGSHILLFLLHPDGFKLLQVLKGHQDWVRCLSFVQCDDGSILLASSAQDKFIRLWKVQTDNRTQEKTETDEKSAAFFASLSLLDNLDASISKQGYTFDWQTKTYSILLEAVLCGHEDWVYSVCWQPAIMKQNEDGKQVRVQEMCLLSASMDKSMMVWRPQQEEGGIWLNEVRVGELGGNTLGFYGGLFSPDGKSLLAHGYNGAFHLWQLQEDTQTWNAQATISGHFGAVNDCCWNKEGEYFLTISQDQTARIFAPADPSGTSLCEIARPQIHGYDLQCGCFIQNHPHRFVTGAEEKIYRVFDAPQSFVHNLKNIAGIESKDAGERPLGANMPSLGLSNKPVFTLEGVSALNRPEVDDNNFEGPKPADPVFLQRPPFEEELLQSTLWPEIQKLYGHGNYTFCITSSNAGKYIATAVSAKSDPEQASIRVWDTTTWKEVANLRAHKLTVTQLRFSHSDEYLLSSGRDRQFSIFKRTDNEAEPYVLVSKQSKSHERIIWSCDWSVDDKLFVTGSRDKTCKIWTLGADDQPVELTKFSAKVGVTAVAFAPVVFSSSTYLVAVGFEDGLLQLWSVALTDDTQASSTLLLTLPTHESHCDAVTRISWRKYSPEYPLTFVSCSLDNSVRVFKLK